jgi:NitT/TauT family transport system substrate-binding protein
MAHTRRTALGMLSATAGTGLAGLPLLPFVSGGAAAQAARSMQINLLGFALGIHVPTTAAILDLMPAMQGYATPKTQRMDHIRTLTQTLVAGAAECGQTDPITTMRAVEAGADLKIVGFWYLHTSLVFLANADKIREFKDLEKPENVVAINSKGDITEVMLVGPLAQNGVDAKKVTIVEIGGSGARMKALQSGRVHAVPVHFDQASALAKQGNYKVLLEPWKAYNPWINEVWVVNGAWLKSKDNQRALVDLLKATITGFRKANDDFAWYAQMYRKHVTLPKANETKDEDIRPLWEGLAQNIKAWPRNMDLNIEYFDALMPVYKAAGAVEGKILPRQIIDTSFVKQALEELGS